MLLSNGREWFSWKERQRKVDAKAWKSPSRKRRSRKLRPPIMKIKGASKSAAALVPILQCGHGKIEVLHQTVIPAGQVARRAQSRKNFQHG